jgi:transmembrane protein TMEM260 (protein O-mannosyltransferase)
MSPVGISFVLALVLYARTAARTITTRYGGADGGELAATALSGGVAHPSGYPTYMLLARTALLLPFGEPAARLALLSAGCAALAVACTAAVVAGIAPQQRQLSSGIAALAAGSYAGLSLAVSPSVWSQAIIVEVYALHLLWLALSTLLGLYWLRTERTGTLLSGAFCLGLGLGTHLTLLSFMPAALLAWRLAPRRPALSARLRWALAGALLLGISVYGLLPLWSARGAMPSWGDQRTLAGFWAHVSGAEYRYLVGAAPPAQRISRLSFAARDLLTQPGPVGLALGLWFGLPYGWAQQRPLIVFIASVALCNLLFASIYGGDHSAVYLLPWTWAWCIWAGLGVYRAATILQEIPAKTRSLLGQSVLIALLILSLLWPLPARYRQLDLHAETAERDRALAQLATLPPDALLLTSQDLHTFSLWYVQRAFHVRSDVLVIDTRLLDRPWYSAQVGRALRLGTGQPVCQALQTSTRPGYIVTTGALERVDIAHELQAGCRST